MARKRMTKDWVEPALEDSVLKDILAETHGFLDYITLELVRDDHLDGLPGSLLWFYDYAKEAVYDQETGEATGPRIPTWCFWKSQKAMMTEDGKLDYMRDFMSLFSGAQWEGTKLVYALDLPILTIHIATNLHLERARDWYNQACVQAKAWCLSFPDNGHRTSFQDNVSNSRGHKGDMGFSIAGKSSDHRLTVYLRRNEAEKAGGAEGQIEKVAQEYVRLEMQLRGKDCQGALKFLKLSNGYYEFSNQYYMKDVFDLSYNKWYGEIRLLDDGGSIEGALPYANLIEGVLEVPVKEKVRDANTFRRWFESVVAPSVYKHYKQSHVDLSGWLLDFMRLQVEQESAKSELQKKRDMQKPFEHLKKQLLKSRKKLADIESRKQEMRKSKAVSERTTESEEDSYEQEV